METKQVASGSVSSIGFGGVLFIVFLVLKLLGKIEWSWFWVTAPLWMPFAAVIGVIGLVLLFVAITAAVLS